MSERTKREKIGRIHRGWNSRRLRCDLNKEMHRAALYPRSMKFENPPGRI